MAISKIKVGNEEHELNATNDSNGNKINSTYLPKSGGSMNDGATIKLSTYGTRYVTLSGNSITADMSNETGGWAGNFASVKDPSGATTSMLGWYGSASGLNHIYMGGTYSDPYMKMTPAGQFTFKNRPKVGSSDIALKSDIPSGGSVTVDSALSSTSTNPVQNKVVNSALSNKLDANGWTTTADSIKSPYANSTQTQYKKDKIVADNDVAGTSAVMNFPSDKTGTIALIEGTGNSFYLEMRSNNNPFDFVRFTHSGVTFCNDTLQQDQKSIGWYELAALLGK